MPKRTKKEREEQAAQEQREGLMFFARRFKPIIKDLTGRNVSLERIADAIAKADREQAEADEAGAPRSGPYFR